MNARNDKDQRVRFMQRFQVYKVDLVASLARVKRTAQKHARGRGADSGEHPG